MPRFDVIGIGVNTVDSLFCLPPTYQVDHKNPTEEAKIQAGGPAGTASCLCAMLGWKTGFVTPMGQDMLSRIATEEFTSRGVSSELFVPYEQASPVFSVIQVDPRLATRTIFYNEEHYQYVEPSDMRLDIVKEARVILVDCYEPDAAMAALEAVRETACRSVLDLEAGEPEWLWRAIELGTDVIMPFAAARKMTGAEAPEEILAKLADKTRAQIVVTDGIQGSWALMPNGIYHQPAFKVKAIDTTGCGDVFHGAYAAGLLEGMPLELRLEFAAWLASMTAKKIGGREALLTRTELLARDRSKLSNVLQNQLASMKA